MAGAGFVIPVRLILFVLGYFQWFLFPFHCIENKPKKEWKTPLIFHHSLYPKVKEANYKGFMWFHSFLAPFSLNYNGWSERSEMKEAWIQWKERGAKWMEHRTLLILLTRANSMNRMNEHLYLVYFVSFAYLILYLLVIYKDSYYLVTWFIF